MDVDFPKINNITTGQIYKAVIDRERAGEYLGQTVQFIPHITDEVTRRICLSAEGYEVVIIEIGGTVGDYENVPFLFAIKALERELGADHVAYALVTYLPVPGHIGEMKTKPTQQAIRMLGEQGIMPDFIICRSEQPLDVSRRKKIEVFANITADHIIAAPDVPSVYQMPIELERQELGTKLLQHLKLPHRQSPNWSSWQQRVEQMVHPKHQVRIAVVGKYVDSGDFSLTDSYLSICHALTHAGAEHATGVDIAWIDAKQFELDPASVAQLDQYDGILIPGGFGTAGVEGKITVINYARTHGIPFLGLCYGLQLAVVEFARNVCGLAGAHTTEVAQNTPYPVIDILPWQKELLEHQQYGGTMRLGLYKAAVKDNTMVHKVYTQAGFADKATEPMYHGALLVGERHRHRYERFDPAVCARIRRSWLCIFWVLFT